MSLGIGTCRSAVDYSFEPCDECISAGEDTPSVTVEAAMDRCAANMCDCPCHIVGPEDFD
jgi:hypothetical protein